MAFADDLRSIINLNSMENGSNTPDFVLRDFLCDCLDAWDTATNARRNLSDPKLTDEEREALRHAEEATAGMLHVYTDERPAFDVSATLRGLLDRLT